MKIHHSRRMSCCKPLHSAAMVAFWALAAITLSGCCDDVPLSSPSARISSRNPNPKSEYLTSRAAQPKYLE